MPGPRIARKSVVSQARILRWLEYINVLSRRDHGQLAFIEYHHSVHYTHHSKCLLTPFHCTRQPLFSESSPFCTPTQTPSGPRPHTSLCSSFAVAPTLTPTS